MITKYDLILYGSYFCGKYDSFPAASDLKLHLTSFHWTLLNKVENWK